MRGKKPKSVTLERLQKFQGANPFFLKPSGVKTNEKIILYGF